MNTLKLLRGIIEKRLPFKFLLLDSNGNVITIFDVLSDDLNAVTVKYPQFTPRDILLAYYHSKLENLTSAAINNIRQFVISKGLTEIIDDIQNSHNIWARDIDRIYNHDVVK